MRNILITILRFALRMLCGLLFRIEIRGDRNAFNAQKLLVIANHESLIDGLLLGLYLPINPVFVVYKGALKNPFFRLILWFSDYLTVDPSNAMAMKSVLRLVESGRPVVIFPEGRVTNTGSLMKVYDGPAFVAAKSGASVVPVRLDGAKYSYFSRLGGANPRQLLPKITLHIFPVKTVNMSTHGSAKERRRHAGESMRRIMEEMIFASTKLQTLFDALCDALYLHGRRRRILEDMKQEEYSYHSVLKTTLVLGRLAARMTREGEYVGLLLPNFAPTLGLMIGLGAHHRIPAMLNYTAGSHGLKSACVAADIKLVFTSRNFVTQAKLEDKIAALSESGIKIAYLEDFAAQFGWFDKLWLMAFALWMPRLTCRNHDPETPAVVLFTSGSEGKPKGVVLSHRALMANIAQIRAVFAFSVDDKIFNALPMFHSLGLTAGALLPLMVGTPFFLYPTPLHYRIIPELVYDRGCSVLFGTSTFLGNYARFAHPYDFYRLRIVVAGAEKLADTVRSVWYDKFGLRIFEGYGATETAPVISVNTPMAFRRGTVGMILPMMESRLMPIEGIDKGAMLHVRGPNLMSGYLRDDQPCVLQPPGSSLGKGWYETGDMVEIDEDGYITIVGRIKRFAKIAGEMVSLESVERLAIAASPEHMHAAVSRPDSDRGEIIILFTQDAQLSLEKLKNTARSMGLPELLTPRKLVVVAELPVLGSGKTDYVSLAGMALQA